MNRRIHLLISVALVLLLLWDPSGPAATRPVTAAGFSQAGAIVPPAPGGPDAPEAAAMGTGFTYQGQLNASGAPYSGSCDFQFGLWDSPTAGGQVGFSRTLDLVEVSNGLFTVQNDFGAGAFLGSARWLQITVRCPATVGEYNALAPRQPLTPAPHALFAATAGTLARPGFTRTTLDSAGNVGADPSVTIGADGLGLISYYDGSAGDLKVAHCADIGCTRAFSVTLDSTANVGLLTAITIGADGLGLISYFDSTSSDLKVAHCADVGCTRAISSTLDSAGSVGYDSSITIGPGGLGLISYQDGTANDLKVARCNDVACTSATIATLDAVNATGYYTSITIGTDGLGLISYWDGTATDLKVAHCDDPACSAATITTLDGATSNVGAFTSITIGDDGLGLISYYDATNTALKVAHCTDVACTSATTYTLDEPDTVGQHTEITIGPDGKGLISYYDATNTALKVAHCTDTACSSATVSVIDGADNVGQYPSLAIGPDGLALISYFSSTGSNLKTAHCSNALCSPYLRRR
jgi:preprotein translocase subunit Sec61beta